VTINNSPIIDTLLFDLDGTFIDTAPDMASALNVLIAEYSGEALPFAKIRPYVSNGSAPLITLAFGDKLTKDEAEKRRLRFIDIYQENLVEQSCLFHKMEELIENLQQQKLQWGIVTNKPAFLTEPLLQQLGLAEQAACIVSGDSTPYRKPHPEPMFHACRLAKTQPENCIYVGDDRRDITAGNAANMITLAALYGYITSDDDPLDWNADGVISSPGDIIDWINNNNIQLRAATC